MNSDDVTAVLVNHDSGARLGPLLDALEPEVASIVVVDNASSDGSLDPAGGRATVTVIRNLTNAGFAVAANQGASLARGAWILFVNPDVVLHRGDVARLLAGVPANVAAVAPVQVDERGRIRAETGGFEPSLVRYFIWAVVPTRFHHRWGPWLAPPVPGHDFELDWLSGALLGIRRTVFEQLGSFDERYFLYHEDVDFGRRARAAGYRLICRPGVRVYHEVAHGTPSWRVNAGRRSLESLALDFEGWRRRVLGVVLGLGYGLRAALGSGTGQAVARAALPLCGSLIRGMAPRAVAVTVHEGNP